MSQRHPAIRAIVVLLFLAVPMAFHSIEASAACSKSKVKRLSREGKTVTTIARTCEMDVGEVREILDPGPEPGPDPDSGLSPGTPLADCGCWGPVAPGYRERNPICSSGYAKPRMCSQMCPSGGFAWQGVCL